MDPAEKITKLTKVKDAERLLMIPTIVVGENECLNEIAKKVAAAPGCRTIAVVDASGRLVGVIPVSLLIDDIFLWIVPEEFLAGIANLESALEFAGKMAVCTAKDIMQAPVWVKMSETVKIAFERMHRGKLSGLPIVGDENRVIGYIDMMELLLVWIEMKECEEE